MILAEITNFMGVQLSALRPSLNKLRISLRWYRCSGQMVPRGADAWYRL